MSNQQGGSRSFNLAEVNSAIAGTEFHGWLMPRTPAAKGAIG